MYGHVAVGMPGAAVDVGKQQAQQPARPAGFDDVDVGAQPDPRVHWLTIACASSRSSRVVILKASGSPSTTCTWPPMCSTSDASSVKSTVSGLLVGPQQQFGGEALRGLHGAQAGPLRRAQHRAVGVDRLDGVGDRQRGHDGRMPGPQRLDDAHHQLGWRQGSGSVVYQHEVGFVCVARPPPAPG